MKKIISILIGLIVIASPVMAEKMTSIDNAYKYSFHKGKEGFPLSQFQGKVLLVVNTASLCGFAPQYASLEKLYETYKGKGLVVIGVPANDFGSQEPGTDAEIAIFAKDTYHVTFPIVSKESVSGDKAHPFYLWAGAQKKGGVFTSVPRWNFHKYLVDKNGNLIGSYASYVEPNNRDLISDIEKALTE